jgi:hypothetical protein
MLMMIDEEREEEIRKLPIPIKEECIAFYKELTNLADVRFVPYYKMAIKALEAQRYKPIILQEHDAEPRTMKAIIDTETDEIYICRLTRQGAELLGMTIEEVNADD